MFDVAPTELLLVAIVALIVIGPKDLPKAMRVVGHWVGRARGVARHFRSGLDDMMRESELQEMEKRWKSENERIMREHPATPSDVTDPTAEFSMTPLPPAPPASASADPAPADPIAADPTGGDPAAAGPPADPRPLP